MHIWRCWFVIEKNETKNKKWYEAKALCTAKGMRLPELFEWMLACENKSKLGLNNMIGDNWEWSSNVVHVLSDNNENGQITPVIGQSSCSISSNGWIGSNATPNQGIYDFRCVK